MQLGRAKEGVSLPYVSRRRLGELARQQVVGGLSEIGALHVIYLVSMYGQSTLLDRYVYIYICRLAVVVETGASAGHQESTPSKLPV